MQFEKRTFDWEERREGWRVWTRLYTRLQSFPGSPPERHNHNLNPDAIATEFATKQDSRESPTPARQEQNIAGSKLLAKPNREPMGSIP